MDGENEYRRWARHMNLSRQPFLFSCGIIIQLWRITDGWRFYGSQVLAFVQLFINFVGLVLYLYLQKKYIYTRESNDDFEENDNQLSTDAPGSANQNKKKYASPLNFEENSIPVLPIKVQRFLYWAPKVVNTTEMCLLYLTTSSYDYSAVLPSGPGIGCDTTVEGIVTAHIVAIVQPFTLYMFDRNTAYIICQIVFASIYHIARIFIGDPDTVSYKDLTSPSPTSALQLVIVLVLFILIMEHDNKRLFLRQLSAKQKATAAITHKNEFLRYMFHELRIPINVMFLAIDLMVERINDSGCISLGTECEMSRKIADAPRLDTNSGKEKDNYKSDSRSVSNSNSDRSSSSSSSAKSGDCSDDKTDKSNDETDENSRSVIRARARPSARSPASSQTRTTTHVDDVKGGDEGEGFGYLIDLLNVQCKSIQSLLNDSLFLQKLEQRKVELEAACFSFPSLLDRICFSHRLSAQKKGVNIEVVMDSHVPVWTLGDQSRLRQVVENFVSNAVKFCAPKTTITIRLSVLDTSTSHQLDHHPNQQDSSSSSSSSSTAAVKPTKSANAFAATNDTPHSSIRSNPNFNGNDNNCNYVNSNGKGDIRNKLTAGKIGKNQQCTVSKQPSTSTLITINNNSNNDDVHELKRFHTLQLSVADVGTFITQEDINDLFVPFKQIRAGDLQDGGGTGLGLSIARQIIDLMHGSLNVRSTRLDELNSVCTSDTDVKHGNYFDINMSSMSGGGDDRQYNNNDNNNDDNNNDNNNNNSHNDDSHRPNIKVGLPGATSVDPRTVRDLNKTLALTEFSFTVTLQELDVPGNAHQMPSQHTTSINNIKHSESTRDVVSAHNKVSGFVPLEVINATHEQQLPLAAVDIIQAHATGSRNRANGLNEAVGKMQSNTGLNLGPLPPALEPFLLNDNARNNNSNDRESLISSGNRNESDSVSNTQRMGEGMGVGKERMSLPHNLSIIKNGGENTTPTQVAVGAQRQMRVLIVDDSRITRRLTKAVLTQHGVNCTEATNGLEALNIIKQTLAAPEEGDDNAGSASVSADGNGDGVDSNNDYSNGNSNGNSPPISAFDFILMDQSMPVMDGKEATRAIRALKCKTPIIAVTGNALKEDVDAFFRCGITSHLVKPITRAKLVALLTEYKG